MIEAKGLSKAFVKKGARKETVRAINDVSFVAEDGAITGLLGANGAGKSTTLRIISSLIKPDSGTATVDGHDVIDSALGARKNLGFLPHNAGVYPRLTARENIIYYAELSGLSRREALHRCDDLIEMLDMSGFSDRRTEGFSQGQKTKVALARALVHKPKSLILDEPTNGLDVMATRKLRTILRRLKEAGHCILISSHVMQEVSVLCDQVAIISNGEIACCNSVSGLLEQTGQNDLEDAFVVAIGESIEEEL
ncbi:MAG: sodium transport system ATP-binding protein [Flavobacteriales bacterium]|jgi:sodium transport system ATP-binding protein